MVTLFKNARILTMADKDIFLGELLVKDNIIEDIGPKVSTDLHIDKTIDCEQNLLMPGFKNAHAHTAMVFCRSAADDLPLHDWLYNVIFPMEEKFQDGDIYHLTKSGMLEYISGGITACFDMYFRVPEIVKAALDIGFRTKILATSTAEPISLLRNNYLTLNEKGSLVSYCLGIHAEYTTPLQRIKDVANLAQELKAPVYLHTNESEGEVAGCIERYGKRPIELFDSVGMFNYGGGGFHCIYLSDNEIKIAKKLHLNIVSCPGSNSKIASGIAPLCRYQKEGFNIALGTDGAGSNNSLDMFREMYLASVLQKLSTNDASAMDGFDVLKMATVNSAHAMGFDDCDILAKGKYADIIMIDLQNPAMQPINNIAKNIVYSGSKDIVKMTMINGKILYYNHEFFINENVKDIYAKTQEITNRLKGEQ